VILSKQKPPYNKVVFVANPILQYLTAITFTNTAISAIEKRFKFLVKPDNMPIFLLDFHTEKINTL